MAQDWFLISDGKEIGPYGPTQLKEMAAAGRLTPDDLIRRGDTEAATKAGRIKGLFNGTAPVPQRPEEPPSEPTAPKPSPFQEKLGVIAAAAVLFFPVGLFLIWRHPGWAQSRKWKWTGAVGAVILCLAALGSLAPPQPPKEPREHRQTKSKAHAKKADVAPLKQLSLANGRVPIGEVMEYLKRREDLVVNTSSGGIDDEGTPLDRFTKVLGEKCRFHVGGRVQFEQNVSAVLVETVKDNQLAAVMLGTPFDFSRSPSRGNDLDSIIWFVRGILPEAEIRKMVGEEGVRLAYGNDSKPRAHGKAAISIGYNPSAKEFHVTIIVDR